MTIRERSLDLSQIRILPLPSKSAVKKFNCGVPEIDRWVAKSPKYCDQNKARLFTAHLKGNPNACGFYSLSFSSESQSKLNKQDRQIWGSGVPLIYLQYIGVERPCQGAGLGTILLMDALQRAYSVSKNVAFYGVGLRSLNERTTSLYQKFGFAIAPDEEAIPLMILPIWSIADLFEKGA